MVYFLFSHFSFFLSFILFRNVAQEVISEEIGAVEQFVGTVRKELCSLVGEVNTLSSKASAVVKENLEVSNGMTVEHAVTVQYST